MVRGQAGGETHVVGDMDPFSFSIIRVSYECFHIGRDGLNASLIGGIHSGRGEVFNFSMHQQPQRATLIGSPRSSSRLCGLVKPLKRQQIEIADVAMRQQIGQEHRGHDRPRHRREGARPGW